MIYSEVHNYQNDAAVKQILVFGCTVAETRFKQLFADNVEKNGVEFASDTNIGAVFKLRGVLNGKGRYDALIRCGITGCIISELFEDFVTYEEALAAAKNKLKEILTAE